MGIFDRFKGITKPENLDNGVTAVHAKSRRTLCEYCGSGLHSECVVIKKPRIADVEFCSMTCALKFLKHWANR